MAIERPDVVPRLEKFKLELPKDSLFDLKSATSKNLAELLKIAEVTGGIIYEYTPTLMDVVKEEWACWVCSTSYHLPGFRPSWWCPDCDNIGWPLQTTEEMNVYGWQQIEEKKASERVKYIEDEILDIQNTYWLFIKTDKIIENLGIEIDSLVKKNHEINNKSQLEWESRELILKEVYPIWFNLWYFLSKYGKYLLNNPNMVNKDEWQKLKSK